MAEAENKAEVIYLPGELHSSPQHLKAYLQAMIDKQTDAERIVVCPSGCGGGTCGLKATTAELIVPRTRDCLDLLLAARGSGEIDRPKHGVFYTDSWMEHTKNSAIDLKKAEERFGPEEAHAKLRALYKGFEHFYIIDTGTYSVQEVKEYLEPLRGVLDGRVDVVKGEYGILHKIAREEFDADFWVIAKGSAMPDDAYIVNTDL